MSDDKPDKTLIVNPDITLKVNSDIKPVLPKVHPLNFTHFKDYTIVYSYPATGGEADIFRISKNDAEFILKLYRTGCVPKEEILQKIKKLSEEHPEHFIRSIDYGIDSDTGRWYELLEYAKYQTLKEIIDKNDVKQLNFEKILSEIFYSIETLHQHNIIHQDIKPSNILVRSIDPIDLVLADFGVASSFTDDVRQTSLGKGTAHYQAPEQLSGIVSPKTDYWALGMILLEIKNGEHPFKGFDLQHIKFAIVTKGVEVPSELPQRDAILIKGLLTRDPKNRWGAEKVKKWINGDNDIPLFYDYNLGNQQPYTFQGNNYFTPSELVAQFIKNENNWQEARKHLARGYLLKWFEDIKDFDHAVLLNDFGKLKNVDEQLFSVIYSINNKLPIVVYGKTIDLNNLYIFAANSMKNSASLGESTIFNDLTSGKLLYFSQMYVEFTQDSNPIHEVIQKLTGIKPSQIFTILEILFKPDLYLIPDDIDCANQIDTVTKLSNMAIGRSFIPIYRKEDFKTLVNSYILPPGMEDSIQRSLWSTRIFVKTQELQEMNLLIPRNDITTNMDSLKRILPVSLDANKGNIAHDAFKEYIEIAKQLNWGINTKSLDKIKKLKDFKLDDGLNHYLDALLSKKIPWEDRDVTLVDTIFTKFNAVKKFAFLFSKHSVNLFILGITLSTLFGVLLKTGMVLNEIFSLGMIYDKFASVFDILVLWLSWALAIAIAPIILLPIIHVILNMNSNGYRKTDRILKVTVLTAFAVIILNYWISFLYSVMQIQALKDPSTSPLLTQYLTALPSPLFNNFFDVIVPGGMIVVYVATILGLFLIYKPKLETFRSLISITPIINENASYMASVVNKAQLANKIPELF